ncbi:Maestro heat-like repeat-containing protein family member 9, partial [Buceros rhinoceros silvestris]
RAAATLWRTMLSSSRTAQEVLRELLCVLRDWPLHSTCTVDRDSTDVFPLAATMVLWQILWLPNFLQVLERYFPYIFAALLLQIFFSTEQMPEEVNAFWRGCQQKGCLP